MKSLEQITEYLNTVGVNGKDIYGVYGFLYANSLVDDTSKIGFTKSEKNFGDFVRWFESEDVEYNDEDEVLTDEYSEKFEGLWLVMHDIATECMRNTLDNMLQARSIVKAKAVLDVISGIVASCPEVQEIINEVEVDNENFNAG
jgi:hypothetical protein